MSEALRHILCRDPVFLELDRRRETGQWGPLTGLSLFAAVPDEASLKEIVAFLYLFLGPPSQSVPTLRVGFAEITLTFEGPFAVHLTAVIVPHGLHFPGVLCGSVSFVTAFVEFRWGNHRFFAYSTEEGTSVRQSLPDLPPGGTGSAIHAEREAAAEDFASFLLMSWEGGGDASKGS